MQIGCGVYEHTVHGRTYVYLWHYETTGGRRRQIKEYLGRADDAAVRTEAARRVETYFKKAARDLQILRRETLAGIARRR